MSGKSLHLNSNVYFQRLIEWPLDDFSTEFSVFTTLCTKLHQCSHITVKMQAVLYVSNNACDESHLLKKVAST